MADWWEAYKRVDSPEPSMRPMVAHTPKSEGEWWKAYEEVNPDKGTLDEEPRTPGIGEDPRLSPDAVFNPEQTANVAGDTAAGLAAMGPLGASGRLATILGNPLTTGAYAGGRTLLKTGDPEKALMSAGAAMGAHYIGSKGLAKVLGRIVPAAEREAAPVVAETVGEATPASLPPMRDTTPTAIAARAAERQARQAAALAKSTASEASPEAQSVAEAVTTPPRKLAPIPAKGNVKLATVYTKPNPVQGPKSLTEAQIVMRGRQLEAAKNAGLDINATFGNAPAQATEQATEGALMTRLRASVMMKKDPVGLVTEVTQKAAELAQSGVPKEQIGAQIEALYGLTPAKVKQLADAVTMARGMK